MHKLLWLLVLALLLPTAPAAAEEHVPPRFGLATLHGSSYDPDHIGLSIVQGFVLYDYDQIFWHAAPENLRLRIEGNLGVTTDGRQRSFASLNMLALYYLASRTDRARLYGEAGIGLIYTDFHVEGQGLHLNFNPQVGGGIEWPLSGGQALMTGVRFHHISNGETHNDNRGINSWLLQLAVTF